MQQVSRMAPKKGPSGFIVRELQIAVVEVDRCLEVAPPAIATNAPAREHRPQVPWPRAIFPRLLKIALSEGMKMAFSQSDHVASHA